MWVSLGPLIFFQGSTLSEDRKENDKPISAQRETEAGASPELLQESPLRVAVRRNRSPTRPEPGS